MTNLHKLAKVLKLLNEHKAKTTEFTDASLTLFEKIVDKAEKIDKKEPAERTPEENAVYKFIWDIIPDLKRCLESHSEYNSSFKEQYIDAIKLLSNLAEVNKNA